MALSVDDLARYVNTDATSDATYLASVLAEAEALVAVYVGEAIVPEPILNRASLEVGSELFHRRNAPNGVAQFASEAGAQPLRIARDPMVGAYPILNRFVVGGIS